MWVGLNCKACLSCNISKLLVWVGLNCKEWVALNCNYAAHPKPRPNKDFRTLLCKRKTRVTGKFCFLSRTFFIPLCHMLEAKVSENCTAENPEKASAPTAQTMGKGSPCLVLPAPLDVLACSVILEYNGRFGPALLV